MKSYFPILFAGLIAPAAGTAQHVSFPDHTLQRGYYDAPYLRYEAEPGRCTAQGEFLLPVTEYSQQPLQAEASNETALTLSAATDFVEWTVGKEADALTLRFSVPDSPDGSGQKTDLDVMIDGKKVAALTLDSYWSWQYTDIANTSEKYPDRIPGADRFARMRFDEINALLPEAAKEGSVLRLSKSNADGIEVTIDFAELEKAPAPLTAADFPNEEVVVFSGKGSSLESFIRNNQGKRILIAPGKYDISETLSIDSDGSKISGSGIWHTTINFTAKPDSKIYIGNRGVVCEADNVEFTDLSLTTVSRVRYFPGTSKGSGKGLSGSWGKNSRWKNLRVDHFECGAWIADYSGKKSEGLTIEHCRFRNNYADGINLCQGTSGARLSHCSFRNNGDDDIAMWSAGDWSKNHEISYCTAENNWRASSLGFFGGENNRAHHLLVIDGMECGVRANGEFGGTGFSKTGECAMTDITIRRSGCLSGTPGTQGGFWGTQGGAVDIQAGGQYGVTNLRLENIDIYDSRSHGVRISSTASKSVTNLQMHHVMIDGHGPEGWALSVEPTTRGDGAFSDVTFGENTTRYKTEFPKSFAFEGEFANLSDLQLAETAVTVEGNSLIVKLAEGLEGTVCLYDTTGRKIAGKTSCCGCAEFCCLPAGVIIVCAEGHHPVKAVIR